MAHTKGAGFVFSVILVALFSNGACDTLNRTIFPHGFIFGASSSAYQYEGAVKEGGRGLAFGIPSPTPTQEDVARMKEMGLDAFRFSISWSRILPGIKPLVTLHHWDSPQALEDQYGGFLSPRIVEDYKSYTDICFKEFGDRVKHWITFNEPWAYCTNGYGGGTDAPGRCTPSGPGNCKAGDSSTSLIQCAITLYWPMRRPSDNTTNITRFMDPLTRGDYPQSMRTYLGHRLPSFTKEHSEMVKGTYDFIGINYYNAFYALQLPDSVSINSTYLNDSRTA
uniref:Beta-glucosidase 12-like n=1 Tax=Ananas comosus var. bracteatus TaxID=296719 RepID=A0A6V7QXA2_ANACO